VVVAARAIMMLKADGAAAFILTASALFFSKSAVT
jgi:hypothetical protein